MNKSIYYTMISSVRRINSVFIKPMTLVGRLLILCIVFIISSLSAFGQDAGRLIGYTMNSNIALLEAEKVKAMDKLIYFGINADEKGNIDTDKVKRDLTILDSLRQDSKTQISVCFGGWGRSNFFVNLSANEASRMNFTTEVLKLCQEFGLAGVDIDWEFPKGKVQKSNFVLLMRDLHKKLHPNGLEITIAVGFWKKQAKLSASVEPYIDEVNLMLYDNFSPFKGQASLSLVKRVTKRFLRYGVPNNKLIVGVPFYGRHRWRWGKTMSYKDITDFNKLNKKGVYKGYFFDNHNTLSKKLEWVQQQKLGGIMFWELNGDVPMGNSNSLLTYLDEKMHDETKNKVLLSDDIDLK